MKKYKINEIFYSIQTEGTFAGKASIFIRLCGCNLSCPWCDTKHHTIGEFYTKEEIEEKVNILTRGNKDIHIVFTGGEPTLQLSEEEELLKDYYRCIETNGTNKVPSWIDWITCSPKSDIDFSSIGRNPNEIKVVYEHGRDKYLQSLLQRGIPLFLQPLEENGKMNIAEVLDFIKLNPQYRLSLQYHKLIGVR